jgi:hypothetical protein
MEKVSVGSPARAIASRVLVPPALSVTAALSPLPLTAVARSLDWNGSADIFVGPSTWTTERHF